MTRLNRSIILILGASLAMLLSGCNGYGDFADSYSYQPESGLVGTLSDVRAAARAGSARAQYTLANRYFHGIGVPRNEMLGRSWMQKASRQGYGPARSAYQGIQRYQRHRAQGQGTYVAPPVRLEKGYHHSAGAGPMKHKHRDKQWIRSQSSGGYTIEIARGNKASGVARVLQKTPKEARMGQYRNGGSHHGVYGSYKTEQEAMRAMKKLPANVRKGARVKRWSSVHSNMSTQKESAPAPVDAP